MSTHKRTTQYATDEGVISNESNSVVADGALAFDNAASIAASAQVEIDLAFPYAQVKSLLIVASKAVTVYSNGVAGVGGDTLVLPAGTVIAWQVGDLEVCPFTINVTKLYVTNNHATLPVAIGDLRIRILLDITP